MNLDKINNKYIYSTIFLFLLTIVWGYFTLHQQFGDTQPLKDSLSSYNYFKNISPFGLFLFIFLNNAVKAFLVIVAGVVFGLFPLYFIWVNGVLLGATISLAYDKAGLLVVVAGLLPHGIFELPALVIAISYGLWLGVRMIMRIFRGVPLAPAYKKSLSIYFKVVLPLLFVGALVEALITPVLLNAALAH